MTSNMPGLPRLKPLLRYKKVVYRNFSGKKAQRGFAARRHSLERNSGSKRQRFEFRVAPVTLPLPQEWNGPSPVGAKSHIPIIPFLRTWLCS
jgi:hypothetical protein